jgi:hypothetical protein
MSDYDSDILEWSEQQAALLKRRALGEFVNENDLDWSNIAEEIESVGRSQLSSVISYLVQALAHELKARAWPNSREVSHWRGEARRFRGDAAEAFAPSMRRRIDITYLYRRALRSLPDEIDGLPPLPLPETCFTSLDELLDDEQPSVSSPQS